jgi:hypothetical protein
MDARGRGFESRHLHFQQLPRQVDQRSGQGSELSRLWRGSPRDIEGAPRRRHDRGVGVGILHASGNEEAGVDEFEGGTGRCLGAGVDRRGDGHISVERDVAAAVCRLTSAIAAFS